MTAKEKALDKAEAVEKKGNEAGIQECFIIMPIADRDGYEPGHFNRVYDWIIKPACEAAGYEPVRADDVSSSNFIVADILKRIVEAPMTICDISSLNANVMFELGIRQAFGMPVTLIKDDKTRSVFDISGIRYTEYSSSLRADLVKENVESIKKMIRDTSSSDSGITSLMSLVNIDVAELPEKKDVSADTRLILNELHKVAGLSKNGTSSWMLKSKATWQDEISKVFVFADSEGRNYKLADAFQGWLLDKKGSNALIERAERPNETKNGNDIVFVIQLSSSETESLVESFNAENIVDNSSALYVMDALFGW